MSVMLKCAAVQMGVVVVDVQVEEERGSQQVLVAAEEAKQTGRSTVTRVRA